MRSSWKRSQAAFITVILANLGSLFAIWWFDWQAHALLVAYWIEAGVIGAIYVAKIHRAAGTDNPEAIRSWSDIDGERPRSYIGKPNEEIADAFIGQYLIVWFFLGIAIAFIPFAEEDIPLEVASPLAVSVIAASLVASHLFSYWYEFLGDREYERRGPVSLLIEPGPRFLALFCAVFIGAGVALLVQDPFGAIVALVFFKTCADLVQHRRERKRALRTVKE